MKRDVVELIVVTMLSVQLFAQSQSAPPNSAEPRRAFDFVLTTLQGQTIPTYCLWSNKPVVIMIGSYSCPAFRDNVRGFEELEETFSNRVNFAVLYVQEAHPDSGPSPYAEQRPKKQNERDHILLPQPKTVRERMTQASLCADTLKIKAPTLVDGMDNAAWAAFGRAPNSGFLIDGAGKFLEQEEWFDSIKMRKALKKLLDSNSPVSGY